MRTKSFYYAAALLTVIVIGSCKKSSSYTAPSVVTFKATINGASETPANISTATGSATFTYDPSTYILSGTVTYTGLTPSLGHIHDGAVGVAGPVVFPFTALTSPISFTSGALSTAQQNDLMANLFYVNLHTILFPGGEIRGQLIKQ